MNIGDTRDATMPLFYSRDSHDRCVCPICMETLETQKHKGKDDPENVFIGGDLGTGGNDMLLSNVCGHVYHASCMLEWIREQTQRAGSTRQEGHGSAPTCPTCPVCSHPAGILSTFPNHLVGADVHQIHQIRVSFLWNVIFTLIGVVVGHSLTMFLILV